MRRTALVVLVVLATAACTLASPSPSPLASTRQTATPSTPTVLITQPPDTAEPSGAAPTPLDAPPVQDVQLPTAGVDTLSLANLTRGSEEVRNLYQDASLFFFSIGQAVYGYQFGKAAGPDVMDTAQGDDQVLGIDGGQADLVWAIGRYEQSTGRAPCGDAGALSWRLVPSNPIDMTHPQFVNSRIRFCTAAPAMFAMDGMKLAIATEAPRDGHPLAWEIRVTSELNDTPLRTIETDGELFGLDMSGDDVAYVEGDYEATEDAPTEYNTRLMLSTADNPEPVVIAKDAYDVSFSDGRLAWECDPRSSQRDQSADAPSLMTASTTDHTPRVLTTDLGTRYSSPVASADNVTWTVNGHVFVWDAATNSIGRIQGTGNVDQASARNGWLTWLGDANDVQSLNAIELATIFPPVPTPTPTPSPRATPLPPASVAPPQTIDVNGRTWTRFEHDALPNLDGVGGVSVVDGRFLAIGSRCAYPLPDYAGGCGRAEVLLSSTDGLSWTELGTVATQPDGAWNFYQDRRGFFAMGDRDTDSSQVSETWRSSDGGLNWDLVSNSWVDADQCAGDYESAVGQIFPDGVNLIGIGSAIWRSNDGLTWTCVGRTPSGIEITYAHGIFVGAGYTDASSESEQFWRSDDGVDWQKTQAAPSSVEITSVADGFVAIGGGDKYTPPNKLLISPDGRSWTKQPYPFGDADVRLVGSDGSRALVIEDDYSSIPGEVAPGAIWVSSADGSTWTRYQLPPRDGDTADSAALLGNELVVTGSSYNGGDTQGDGIIWSTQIP